MCEGGCEQGPGLGLRWPQEALGCPWRLWGLPGTERHPGTWRSAAGGSGGQANGLHGLRGGLGGLSAMGDGLKAWGDDRPGFGGQSGSQS